jgi:hypothetical protein
MKMRTWWVSVAAVLALLAAPEARAGGACTAVRVHDWWDCGCNQNFAGAGGPPKAQCPTCPGMPRWWVSEPYINLCLSDTPLSYSVSSGQEMAFRFFYRQRTTLPAPDEMTLPVYYADIITNYPTTTAATCGTNATWNNNWGLCLTIWDPQWESGWFNSGGFKPSGPGYAP